MNKYLNDIGLAYLWNKIKSNFVSKSDFEDSEEVISESLNLLHEKVEDIDSSIYAGALTKGGAADKAVSIPFGQVDSTSTSTVFTATIDGITELRDGVCCYLRNGIVAAASGCTLNINNLGALPIYNTWDNSRSTTAFAVARTYLFVYNSSRVSGGCWDLYAGYYSDTNSVGYDIRQNYNGSKKAKKAFQRYQLLMTTMDGMLLPVYSGSYTTGTAKTLNDDNFDIFGEVYYYGYTSNIAVNAAPGSGYLYSQASNTLVDLRYSFNTGSTLVAGNDIYLVCVIQRDGSVKLADSPLAFGLPSVEDGLLYKRLGKCYDTYRIVLELHKPVYYFKNGAIREFTNANDADFEYFDEFTKRTSDREATVEVQGLKGRTLIWNQLVQNGNFSNGTTGWTNCGTTTNTVSNGIISSVNSTGEAWFGFRAASDNAVCISGHKYLLTIDAKTSVDSLKVYNIYHNDLLTRLAGSTDTKYLNIEWQKLTGIFLATTNCSSLFGVRYYSSTAYGSSVTIYGRNARMFDLTKMFGSGNEPATVEEFEKLFPEDYYAYNAGSIINGSITGIASYNSSGQSIGSVSIPVTTLTGKPSGSNTSEVMFPNGLNGVGSVRDEIDLVNGTAIKRVGVVDLGTLDWSKSTTVTSCFYISRPDIPPYKKTSDPETLNSKSWSFYGLGTGTSQLSESDKIFSLLNANYDYLGIYIRDTSYESSTAAAFKTAMSDVYLYYELATPVEYTLDNGIDNTIYTIINDGEERVLPYGGNTPNTACVEARIKYSNSLIDYNKKSFVINVTDTDYVVPSGTYNFITTALAEEREVIVNVHFNEDTNIYTLRFTDNDYHSLDGYYRFSSTIDAEESLIGSFTIYDDDTCEYIGRYVAPGHHTHGAINDEGAISSDITIANGDKLVVTDSSNNSKIARASVTFDGSTTTKALSKKGTWEDFYSKPSGGIPETDLASAVQTSLDKADTALYVSSKTSSGFSLGSVDYGSGHSYNYTLPYGNVSEAPGTTDHQRTIALLEDSTFTGTPKAPTAASGTNTTQIATTAFVQGELGGALYAGSVAHGGAANKAVSIPFGQVDSTSTSTVFTATIDGITELRDGVCMYLRNGVVTSAAGYTINVNNLGAKPVYQTMASATQTSTLFNVDYTFLFVYNSSRVSGGCWDAYYGYNSNTDTVGYQLRTNSCVRPTVTRTRYYRLLFSSADDTHWVPANTSYDSSSTSVKTVSQTPINPFGRIVYMSGSTNYPANTNVGATVTWDQYAFTLGYSFNSTGSALTLTYPAPVYIKCSPLPDGSAIIDSTTPYVLSLPATDDNKIYIFLGTAYSATAVELCSNHPVYCRKDGIITKWTGCNFFENITVKGTLNSGSTTNGTTDISASNLYSLFLTFPSANIKFVTNNTVFNLVTFQNSNVAIYSTNMLFKNLSVYTYTMMTVQLTGSNFEMYYKNISV